MLNVIFLTEKFYRRYKDCPEIEQKTSRPYIRVGVLIDGVLWAIPMRSNINHEHTIWTDKANKCGIDFTKAVVINNPAEYISSIKPHIRPNEFEVLKSINSYTIEQNMRQYIKKYRTDVYKRQVYRREKPKPNRRISHAGANPNTHILHERARAGNL